MQSLVGKILARIYGHGKGYAFSSKDFVDLADRSAVDQTLSRLCSRGIIRRVVRGVYDFPEDHPDFGTLSPDFRQVAHAIARKNGIDIQPSGAVAANVLGLSTQVPAKIVYLTNGKSRTLHLGNRKLELKRVSPKELQPGSAIGALVIQALRYLGKENTTKQTVEYLREKLSAQDRKRVLKDARYSEDWIWKAAQSIAEGSDKAK